MIGHVVLRAATVDEVDRLTEIAIDAKAHWGYPSEWIELWRPSLTFDADLLEREWVHVAAVDAVTLAVAAVSFEAGRPELSHLWVDPVVMGQGLGRRLFEAAADHARSLGAKELQIVADPHAEHFYKRLGASRIGTVASKPAGRRIPLMVLPL